jgi:hypothetical protein
MATLVLGRKLLTSLQTGNVPADDLTDAQNEAAGWVRAHLDDLYDTSGWTTDASTPTLPRLAALYFGSAIVMESRFLTDSGQKSADESVFLKLRERADELIERAKVAPLFKADGTRINRRAEAEHTGPAFTPLRPHFPEQAGQLLRLEHGIPREDEAFLEDYDLYNAVPPC